MDFDLSADQRAFHEAIVRIVDDNRDLPRTEGVVAGKPFHRAEAMERDLAGGGFLGIARETGCGAVEAAILVYEAARSPLVAEVAASALIGPLLVGEDLTRPIAVAREADLGRGVRFLPGAKTLIVDLGDDVAIVDMDGLDVVPLDGPYAYPVGKLAASPDWTAARRLGGSVVSTFRRLWRLGLALEIAAAMEAATDFTTDYVKQRRVFGRPVGTFQAVQHRLSADAEKCRAVYWLAMKAAWSGTELDAALAALHGQRAITQVVYDAHQFNGALGMTLEHALHLWTFRLRWLVGEMGGYSAQSAAVAELAWPDKS